MRASSLPLQLDIRSLTAFAKKHLDDCTRFHPICSSNIPKFRPTRIIDVGLEATAQNICLTTLKDDMAQYVTLSHCWGDTSAILTTTKDTIKQRHRSIPFRDLPKTFQDAVQITRALGLRYLWIDSLCIIQDDKADWELESAKMAEIYLESCLTIAATASVDSTGGFFFNRWTSQAGGEKNYVETFEFHRTFRDADVTIYARQGLDSGHQRMSGYASTSTNTAPLLHRAWAYQERMLAPRMLHVHMEEMFWECKCYTICECGYLSWEREHLDRNKWFPIRGTLTLKSRIALAVDEATPVEDVHTMWLDIVEEYSMLALTKESDRLPALSGLAKYLSQRVQSIYLAGLWESSLAIGLLWHRCSVLYSSCFRDKLSNVPSWSWASIVRTHQSTDEANQLNHITYDEVREGIIQDPRLKILNAACQVTGTNPFGEVSGGTISIEGALIIAKYACPLYLARPQVLYGTEASGVHIDIRGPGEPAEVLDGGMVFCLLFGMSGYDFAGHALILKAVGANTYRRVGYLNLDSQLRWFDNVIPFVVNII
ncbi:heterokaryon incompatibility protein-domain-containing protein [Leptodontidium sp. 2 PMI_412]|nr:heterokaryon incompatibility protein-domain-containing protein [Leptodontidium sp. 2 PMI_412]